MEVFDPKRFGVIEGQGELIYDKITSSYNLNLPTDYYQRYIQSALPKKESGNGKWFVRPHHVETLTTHVRSVKDDVLNTRYYSHYENPKDQKKKPEIEEATIGLEEQLQKMKEQIRLFQMRQGTWDPDKEEELY